MKQKVPIKNFYLVAVIAVGLVCLAVGSTYAMFVASASIDTPILLSSSLASTEELLETIDVVVAAGSEEHVVLKVSNNTSATLNYAIWYMTESQDIETITDSDVPIVGTIDASQNFSFDVYVVNNGSSTATVQVGVSSNSNHIVLSDNMRLIREGPLDASLEANTANIKLDMNEDNKIGRIGYTYKGDGKVTCQSGNEDIATCAVNTSSKTVTVTPKSSGKTNIVIGATSGDIYKAAQNVSVGVDISQEEKKDLPPTNNSEEDNNTDTSTDNTSNDNSLEKDNVNTSEEDKNKEENTEDTTSDKKTDKVTEE